MKKKVWEYITQERLIEKGQLVIVAVSGGPDSVALLRVLLLLSRIHGFSLHAAHMNHGLREEAKEDELLVQDLCREWKVPLTIHHEDVGWLARTKKQSVEEAGRLARYDFLKRLRSELGAHRIATGHHRGDQAETVLLHLVQGTGNAGLQGMLPQRGNIIRPFLNIDRQEIMAYVRQNELPYRIDLSNYDKNYLRNRIRMQLLPLLEKEFNPRMVDGLCRLAETAREENRYWNQEVNSICQQIVSQRGEQGLLVEVEPLQGLPLAMQRRFMHQVLTAAGGRRISWEDVNRVLGLLEKQGSSKRVRVSGGLWVQKSYDYLEIGVPQRSSSGFCYRLPVPGRIMIPEISLQVTTRLLSERPGKEADLGLFDWDHLQKPLYVRSRRAGDRFCPSGLGGTKKVKDLLNEARVPVSLRDKVGILCSDEDIYWIIGHRKDIRGQISANTQNFLAVKVEPIQ